MEKIELLAPCGDLEMLKTAVNSGADAVYLGLNAFNARMKATNFTYEDLKSAINFAHLFNVKVYITVNTIINENEIESFLLKIKEAIELRADAFIVQDLGVAYLLKNHFENIVLHASTQMGVHNLEGAKILEKIGFKRVILARETTLEDIKLIKQNTNLEIECFIHGALCVAFSGNCYLSSIIKNKSGNRGECLQLCRLFYTALENQKIINEGYLLSTRDLCYATKIKELIDAGVTSFKIEGRLKRQSYVAQVISVYKKLLNGKQFTQEDEDSLLQSFSRGDFNKGKYLDNENENIINQDIQNHLGKKIGVVTKVEKFKNLNKIFLKLNHKLSTGDGLKFVSKEGFVHSLGVGNIEFKNNEYIIYSKTFPNVLDDVYLTVDSEKEKRLLEIKRKLQINAKFTAKINQKPLLKFNVNDTTVIIYGNNNCEKAKSRAITKENIIKSLHKINDTNFDYENIEIILDNDLFIPLVDINEMRRQAISKLEEKIIEQNSPQELIYHDAIKPKLEILETDKEFIYVENEEQLDKINLDNKNVIFSPEIYSKTVVNNFIDKVFKINKKVETYLDLPIISNYQDVKVIKEILDEIKINIVVNNIGQLNFIDERKYIIGYGMNIANSYSIRMLNELGAKQYFFLSKESFANEFDIRLIKNDIPFPLMTFKHCPFKQNYKTNCNNCSYNKNLIYQSQAGNKFIIKRKKIINCYFGLYLLN